LRAKGATRAARARAEIADFRRGGAMSFPNPHLVRRDDGALLLEGVTLADIAQRVGTPTYVYSKRAMLDAYRAYAQAFAGMKHRICYALKANSNLAVISLFAKQGSGFDIVSGGELMRVIAAGADPSRVIFSGVAKTAKDMEFALKQGIDCFNIESESELHRLQAVAKSLGRRAPITFRVNPDVDAKTHPYISTGLKSNKFGVAFAEAERLYRTAATFSNIEIVGIECHIGSQLTELAPYEEALEKLLGLTDRLGKSGIGFDHIDIGGGVGINYTGNETINLNAFAQMVARHMKDRPQTLYLEPGRSLVGNAGLMLTTVEYLKHGETKNFAIVDAGMNDLIRPSLYQAHHDIVEVQMHSEVPPAQFNVVGPVCESGCFLGNDRALHVREGDLLAVLSAGAYGFVQSSNYNTRARACEVMVDDERVHVIRERESLESLFANEHVVEF
jgi:diaminopimelate decarboxylase